MCAALPANSASQLMSHTAAKDLAECSNITQLLAWAKEHSDVYQQCLTSQGADLPVKSKWNKALFDSVKGQLLKALTAGNRTTPTKPQAPGIKALKDAARALASCANTFHLKSWATEHPGVWQHAREALRLPAKSSWTAEDFLVLKSSFTKYFTDFGIPLPPPAPPSPPTANGSRPKPATPPLINASASSKPSTPKPQMVIGIRALTTAARAIAACTNTSQLNTCCAEHGDVYHQAKDALSLPARSSWKGDDFTAVQAALLKHLTRLGVKAPEPAPLTKPVKQSKASDTCDEEGRLYAELCSGEDIAKGFGGVKNTLDIALAGQLADTRQKLLEQVPDRDGNYMWLIRAPRRERWVPVYLGKAGGGDSNSTLRARFDGYINTNGTFGPKAEQAKYAVMLDVLSRGFSIQARFRTSLKNALESETATLERFNFPLNYAKNSGYRPVKLPGGDCIERYPVRHAELQATAQSLYQLVHFNKTTV